MPYCYCPNIYTVPQRQCPRCQDRCHRWNCRWAACPCRCHLSIGLKKKWKMHENQSVKVHKCGSSKYINMRQAFNGAIWNDLILEIGLFVISSDASTLQIYTLEIQWNQCIMYKMQWNCYSKYKFLLVNLASQWMYKGHETTALNTSSSCKFGYFLLPYNRKKGILYSKN